MQDVSANMDLAKITDFLHEVGMLKRTPRTGYQFLGTGSENVAEHCYRTTVIGYILAKLAGADLEKTVYLCLFHDVHESRVGDMNYVNRMYNHTRDRAALEDALQGTGLEEDILPLHDELEANSTLEASLAEDADQLDLMLNLKEQEDLGNKYATKWLECALARLKTQIGKELGSRILESDHTDWWFASQDKSWWIERKNKK